MLVLAAFGLTAGPALADCAEDIKALRGQIVAVKESARREELQKLVDKAEKDEKAGRAKLCGDAVEHARALLK